MFYKTKPMGGGGENPHEMAVCGFMRTIMELIDCSLLSQMKDQRLEVGLTIFLLIPNTAIEILLDMLINSTYTQNMFIKWLNIDMFEFGWRYS